MQPAAPAAASSDSQPRPAVCMCRMCGCMPRRPIAMHGGHGQQPGSRPVAPPHHSESFEHMALTRDFEKNP
jgi:hypothetical protein